MRRELSRRHAVPTLHGNRRSHAMGSRLIVVSLLLASGWAQAQSSQCATLVPPSIPVRPTLVPALAPELALPSHQLGAPTGVLSQAFDESQSVDQVLFRLRVEGCSVANALPAPTPASGIIDPATYKPKTEFDNTPWRFNMSQNGKQMTADEFSAWMKARGVRVAKGGAPAATPAVVPAIPADEFSTPAPAPATPATPTAPAAPAAPATPAADPKPPQGN